MSIGAMRAVVLAVGLAPVVAFAQATLELSQPYGNEVGCRVIRGEAVPDEQKEDTLILRADTLTASASTCEFLQVLAAKDGTRVATALCDLEGEDGRSVGHFTFAPSNDDPTALVVRDEYGAPWDEVKPCQ